MTNPYQPTPPPTPPQQPGFSQTPPPSYPPQRSNNSNALASMILGIAGLVMLPLGIILGPLAILFSKKAKKQIAANNENGENYAKVGMITGTIAICLGAFIIAFYAIFFSLMFGNFPFFDIGSIRDEYNEKQTISNMNFLADKLDDYFKENNNLPADSQILDGMVSNENVRDEISANMQYSSSSRRYFEDGWGRQIVYDCLIGPNGVSHINDAFGYDKDILKKANPSIKATYILWSKGADLDDPSDDIYFIKGRGIVRPDGYEADKQP